MMSDRKEFKYVTSEKSYSRLKLYCVMVILLESASLGYQLLHQVDHEQEMMVVHKKIAFDGRPWLYFTLAEYISLLVISLIVFK